MEISSKSELDSISINYTRYYVVIKFCINNSYDIEEFDNTRFVYGTFISRDIHDMSEEKIKKYVLEKIKDPKFKRGGGWLDDVHSLSELKLYDQKSFVVKIKQRARKKKILKLLK